MKLPSFPLQPGKLARLFSAVILLTGTSACEFHYSVDNGPGKPKKEVAKDRVTTGSQVVRVMTYNIQYLSTRAAGHGNRIEKLRKVVADINPHIVGVQEVEDRAAMELVFPPAEWQIVIDDDSPDKQDVALAVRKPWQLHGVNDDLDADDENFLAEEERYESLFPIRRDGLFVQVSAPGGDEKLTVVNIHAKARVGGRTTTEPRRTGASAVLVEIFKDELKGHNIVLMGDFNDAPDDASLNRLETGDPKATAGDDGGVGAFMVNLGEPLWQKNMVTQGASAKRLNRVSGLVNNIYPDSRKRNANGRGRDVGTGPVMMDQILVSANLKDAVVPESVQIYRKPIALEGNGFSRTSDHLPVFADIRLVN